MKPFVIGFILWFTLIMPGSVEGAEEAGYQIVAFKASLRKAIEGDKDWKVCGNYFAEAETTKGKYIHFTFEEKTPDETSTTFAFAPIDRVVISINEKVESPTVIILGNERSPQFFLRMKMEDYRAGLPCLAKGTKV